MKQEIILRVGVVTLIILSFLLISGSSAFGAVLNVPSIYSTLQEAIDVSNYTDTIVLSAGIYQDSGFFDLSVNNKGLWIVGDPAPGATKINLLGNIFLDFYKNSGFEIIFEDIEFTGETSIFNITNSGYFAVNRCRFIDCPSPIVDTFDISSNKDIFNSYFSSCGTCITMSGETNLYVYYNTFVDNSTVFKLQYALNPFIVGNIFVKNDTLFSYVHPDYYNVINFNRNLVAYNNYGVTLTNGILNMSCNNIFGNGEDYLGIQNQTGINGNISEDPLFCDTSFATIEVSPYSPVLPLNNSCYGNIGSVKVGSCYCGDVNLSGQIGITDLTYLLDFMFRGGPPPSPLLTGDIDGSGEVNITDLTYLIDYMFRGGPAPVC